MSILFEPVKIKGMELRNRFVRSATLDGCADREGNVTDEQIELFSKLACGGAGLIISGIAYVHPSGQISPNQNSIATDSVIKGFKNLTKTVHNSGAKIALQLFHAGREARFVKSKNIIPWAPSLLEKDKYFNGEHFAINQNDIWEVVKAFGDSSRRAREAGFDAVQIHGAHAYLLSQFLSPHTNRRNDFWGGKLKNRLRLHHEIYRDIRKNVGYDYPMFLKIGVEDGFKGGLNFKEGKQAAKCLAELGFDALEISQGLRGKKYKETEYRSQIKKPEDEAYFRRWCIEIKKEVKRPIMMVGGIRSFQVAEEIIDKKEADLISLCRPFIREPDIINRWKRGNYNRSKCVSCNKCLEMLIKGNKLFCVQQQNLSSA
jgi:2,4-dienoyl-CoA reductase-like NADH-dependent reductase (Old Yellow Enzyme family)